MDMTEPTLKPCPRCDGQATIYDDAENGCTNHFWPQCLDCGLRSVGCFHSKEAAAAWWNERPAEQAKPSGHLYSFTCPNCGPMVEIQVSPEGTARKITCANCGSRLDGVTVEAPAELVPTRNAAEPPPAPKHECPYGGAQRWYEHYQIRCGDHGWLCDRCQQDRADRRTRALVRAVCASANMSPVLSDDIIKVGGLW